MELMKNFKMDVYDKEVFVFTPRGDLYKLPKEHQFWISLSISTLTLAVSAPALK